MASPSCGYNPYMIPRLYVEGLESNEYLVLRDGDAIVAEKCSREGRCYGKAVYGTLLEELVDLIAKKTVRSFIVVLPPDYREALMVERDIYVEPIPVEGMRTTIEVCEGSKVEEGSVIGYIVTRKYELRKVRSHVKGVVVYIYSSPEAKPDRNIVFIAGEDIVRRIRIQR